MKTRRAIIVVSLIEESSEKSDEDIEKEILEELKNEVLFTPWVESIERVTVIDESAEERTLAYMRAVQATKHGPPRHSLQMRG